jgi:hypothetical protein
VSVSTLTPPARFWAPVAVDSQVDLVADFAAMYGRPLDGEQHVAVEAFTRCDRFGQWAAFETCVVEARQNGKTGGIVTPIVLTDLFLGEPDRITWTAHLTKTSTDSFLDCLQLIDGCADLSRRVKRISRGKGDQSIELVNGALLDFLARSVGGGRGIGGKRIVFDEALILAAEAMGAMIPTLAARRNVQINYASSAGLKGSDQLRSLRDRAVRSLDPANNYRDESLAYLEWKADGGFEEPGCEDPACTHIVGNVIGCVLDDEEQWAKANPTLGRRISKSYVRKERRSLAPRQFAIERAGWWDDPIGGAEDPLTVDQWVARQVDDTQITGDDVAFGVALAWDRSAASISVAGRLDDGRLQVELVRTGRGIRWVAKAVTELLQRHPGSVVGLRSASAAAGIIPDLETENVEPELLSAGDYIQACGDFAAAVKADPIELVHLPDPDLEASVRCAATKGRGDGGFIWWATESAGDITALESATIATHTFKTTPREQAAFLFSES